MNTSDGQRFFASPPHPPSHRPYRGRLIIGGTLDGCVTNCIEREFISPALKLTDMLRESGGLEPLKKERYLASRLGRYVVYVLDGLDWPRWLLQCHPKALEFMGAWGPEPEPEKP